MTFAYLMQSIRWSSLTTPRPGHWPVRWDASELKHDATENNRQLAHF
jgi:hypothetical protein